MIFRKFVNADYKIHKSLIYLSNFLINFNAKDNFNQLI